MFSNGPRIFWIRSSHSSGVAQAPKMFQNPLLFFCGKIISIESNKKLLKEVLSADPRMISTNGLSNHEFGEVVHRATHPHSLFGRFLLHEFIDLSIDGGRSVCHLGTFFRISASPSDWMPFCRYSWSSERFIWNKVDRSRNCISD